MQTSVSIAWLLVCACSLEAQITTTLNRLPNGVEEVRIRNNSPTSLVAYAVTVNRVPQNPYASNAPFVVYSDPLLDPDAKPLPAGEERVVMAMSDRPLPTYTGKLRFVPFVAATHNLEEPVAAAGILDNGATTGDAALLRTIVVRRSNMLQAIETALEMLSDVGKHNVPREQLIERFKKMAVSARRWYIPPEQRVAEFPAWGSHFPQTHVVRAVDVKIAAQHNAVLVVVLPPTT